ncbi:MAG: glycosyltransferase [Candidatus Eisenbacteria bacterium]|nr:glycosyltransferase [Candidatus Eisenbacteria bacterium]
MHSDHPLVRALAFVHVAAQCGLLIYGAHRLLMLVHWLRRREPSSAPLRPASPKLRPSRVTVQLPIYNERFVAERLIDAAAALRWPRGWFEIQVLDDSTDDTRSIVDRRAVHWRERGVEVTVLRREDRGGFKAGALAAGLRQARGEFIAIFDADFLPEPDFLERTMGPFADPRVGMVQARWGFVNAEHSWLTRAQSVSLGAHFRIEHQVRYLRRLFFNFNGTAGVWRRNTIEDAGGWEPDTVTEDLDLSYRAQLAGWRFVYLDDVVVPSELPVTLGALRAQQRRWAKGSLQTARKILPRVARAQVAPRLKFEAAMHLLGNLGWLLGAVLLATLYPAILFHTGRGWQELVAIDLPLVLGSTGTFLFYFICAAMVERGRQGWRTALLLPVLSVGMAPVVSMGLVEGAFARGGDFERTPKYGVRGRDRLPTRAAIYHRPRVGPLLLNAVLLLHAVVPVVLAVQSSAWAAVPPLLLIPVAFGAYLVQDLLELGRMRSSGTI